MKKTSIALILAACCGMAMADEQLSAAPFNWTDASGKAHVFTATISTTENFFSRSAARLVVNIDGAPFLDGALEKKTFNGNVAGKALDLSALTTCTRLDRFIREDLACEVFIDGKTVGAFEFRDVD